MTASPAENNSVWPLGLRHCRHLHQVPEPRLLALDQHSCVASVNSQNQVPLSAISAGLACPNAGSIISGLPIKQSVKSLRRLSCFSSPDEAMPSSRLSTESLRSSPSVPRNWLVGHGEASVTGRTRLLMFAAPAETLAWSAVGFTAATLRR